MAEASIPVDLFNAGQVLGCMGFLEAADVLLRDAAAGFDWSEEADVRFRLRARGDENPFSVVLGFLAESKFCRYAPPGYAEPPRKKRKNEEAPADDAPNVAETFPGSKADRMALPVRLVGEIAGKMHCIEVSHWADGSGRKPFKLYAGNRSAADIAAAMQSGLTQLWRQVPADLEQDPFGVVVPLGGSFNFDSRRTWTGIDAGYSPDKQSHGVEASPVVEIAAALGLENARPDELDHRLLKYGAWASLLPPMLARAALGGASLGVSLRTFQIRLEGKHNKVFSFAREEGQA